MLVLDRSKLPEVAIIEKATWHYGTRTFGTLFTRARSDERREYDFKIDHPEIVDVVMNGKKLFPLPDGWRFETLWYSSEWNEASYISVAFTLPHCFDVFGHDKLPEEVGYMLSAHLQCGDAFNFRNFRNWKRGRSLKFLPLLITPKDLRFSVYNPTKERVAAAILQLQEVMFRLGEVSKHDTLKNLQEIYWAVRLDEVHESCSQADQARQIVVSHLQDSLGDAKGKFGFLYQGMPGPQDARTFWYEMNGVDLATPQS